MKHTLYLLLFAVFCSGCSDAKTEAGSESGVGTARLTASASAEVNTLTRANTVELPSALIPIAEAFSLHVTGTFEDAGKVQTFDQSWASVSEVDKLMSRRGQYKATVAYGDTEAEGAGKPCFGGETEFTILARRTIDVTVAATLQNAAFRIAFDEWFTKYYTDAQITIRTESGHSERYTATSDEPIFVKPATKLYMKGTAVKSQTGVKVEFPETQIGTTQIRTLHTIVIGASQAGTSGLNIYLDDAFTPVKEQVIELNDDADPVE